MIRACALLLVGVFPGALASAQDPGPEMAVSVVQRTARVRPFVGERVAVDVLVTVDAQRAEEQFVSLFRRPLDLPLQVDLPWLLGEVGVSARLASAAEGVRIAVGGEEYRAVEQVTAVDGRPVRRLTVEAEILVSTPGELTLAAPRVRWAWASRFEEDLFGTRRPVDRRDASTEGSPLLLDVRPLPTDGRPDDFLGAVGRFQVEATLDRDVVEDGETLGLRLRVTGDGDLGAFGAPRLDSLAGFDVVGRLERPEADARVLVYELAPRVVGAVEVPAVAFPYFDPTGEGAWRVARTAPLPVTVRGTAGQASLDGLPPLLPFAPVDSRDRAGRIPSAPLWGGLLLPWLLAAVVLLRRGAQRRGALPEVRIRRAALRLRRSVARGGNPRAALAACAAEVLDVPLAAVIGPDLEQRLCDAGVRPPEARACATLLRALVGASYGGPPVEEPQEHVLRVAEAWVRGPGAGGRR